VRRLPVPSISLVAGGAVGAGMNLMLATDLTIAAPDAVFDSGFLARSIHPGGGHIALLGRRLRIQDSLAMLNLGWRVDAPTARAVGLVWHVVDRGEQRKYATDLLATAAADPALSRRIRHSIALEVGQDAVVDRGVEIERGSQMWSLGRRGDAGWKR
jgi:enoyl-CoA hydratase